MYLKIEITPYDVMRSRSLDVRILIKEIGQEQIEKRELWHLGGFESEFDRMWFRAKQEILEFLKRNNLIQNVD